MCCFSTRYVFFFSVFSLKFCDEYGTVLDIHIHMIFALVPIMSCAMIRNLKFIAPLSMAANISMAIGLGIILSYCLVDLPPLNSRTAVAHWSQIPLFFGTAIYAFEGISLVSTLPPWDYTAGKSVDDNFFVFFSGSYFIFTRGANKIRSLVRCSRVRRTCRVPHNLYTISIFFNVNKCLK